MKLRNKLIPLFSLAAVSSAVAPIASSCGFLLYNMNDITKNYVPTIAKAKEQTTPTADTVAQDIYFTHLAEDSELLTQDILKYEADKLPSRIKSIEFPNNPKVQEYIATKVQAEIGVKNTSFRRVATTIDKKEHVFYALTTQLCYDVTISTLNMAGTAEHTEHVRYIMNIKDIPTQVYSALTFDGKTPSQKWFVSNVLNEPKYLEAVPGWFFDFDKTLTVTDNIRNKTGQNTVVTKTYFDTGVINSQEQINNLFTADTTASKYLDQYLCFESYHLSDITPVPLSTKFKLLATDRVIEGTYKNTMQNDRTGFEIKMDLFETVPGFTPILSDVKKASFFLGSWAPSEANYKNHTVSNQSYHPFTESISVNPRTINYRYGANINSTQDARMYYLSRELYSDASTKQFSVTNDIISTNTYRLNVADENVAKLVLADSTNGYVEFDSTETTATYPELSYKILSRDQIVSFACIANDDQFYTQSIVLTDDIYATIKKAA